MLVTLCNCWKELSEHCVSFTAAAGCSNESLTWPGVQLHLPGTLAARQVTACECNILLVELLQGQIESIHGEDILQQDAAWHHPAGAY